MKKKVIVFSGYNQRAVIAFLRTLEKNNVHYGIVANTNKDTIFKTKYSSSVIKVRQKTDLEGVILQDILEELMNEGDISQGCAIAPSTEYLNRLMLENRLSIEEAGYKAPLCAMPLYMKISDKKSFVELCRDYNLNTPEEYKEISNIKPPFVAKPITYLDGEGFAASPYLIDTEEEKAKFIDTHKSDYFFYQKKIMGKSLYLLLYIYKDKNYVAFSQENLVQQPGGKSIIGAVYNDFYQTDEARKYIQMLLDLGFYGLVMIEIKQEDDRFYMIEANPRFWGPSQFFVDSGVNLFEDFLYEHDLIKTKPTTRYISFDQRYFWNGGSNVLKNLTYHNYSKVRLAEDFDEWLKHDVYNRDDTIELYVSEKAA
jgi:carbamoylphosphate synthase large subunit